MKKLIKLSVAFVIILSVLTIANAQQICPVTFNSCGSITSSLTSAIGQFYGLILDNASSASIADLLSIRSAGNATFKVTFDGVPQTVGSTHIKLAAESLTASTMTVAQNGEIRTVTDVCAWTNAMVVNLGASLTGDINCFVLPAKTRVLTALVVIDSPDTSANALTVSCGDSGAGATNYILAGDAKAAAGTVYGDAISGAETGAALFDATAKWIPIYMPSYSATTTVSCRFTKTTTNLNTVVGSTGRVILTTQLMP